MAEAVEGERRERERERGTVPSSRVISPSQHRPLNSTPLVETKSDTRKAKLLQMHKPSSVRPLSTTLFPPTPALLSFSLFLSLLPPRHSEFATPRATHLVSPPPPPPLALPPSLSTLAPFSYPLIFSQPFSLRKRRSAIHPFSSLSLPRPYFLFSLVPCPFPVLFFPFLCAARGRSNSLSAFSPLPFSTSERERENSLFPPWLCQASFLPLHPRSSIASYVALSSSMEEQPLDFRLFNPLN